MQVRVNNAFLGSVPLIPGQEASRTMQTRCAGAGRQPASVLQLAFLRLHLPAAQEEQLPGHDADQHAGRHPARYLPRSARLSALRAACPTWRSSPTRASRSRALPTWRETTVVLPPTPTEQEIETFVTLMGHFGRQTGFPALRVTVAGPEALRAGRADRLPRHRHRRRPARLRQAREQPARHPAQRPDPGARHAGLLCSRSITPGGRCSPTSTPNPAI